MSSAPSLAATLVLTATLGASAQVTINEFKADGSEHLTRTTAEGTKTVGAGATWFSTDFDDAAWDSGVAPIGFGSGSVVTDLTDELRDRTPSLYVRKTFVLSAAQAASTDALELSVIINDGFVAYVNGREIARSHTAERGAFVHYDQPAQHNVSARTRNYTTDDASQFLREGTNVLAFQVHNGDETVDLHAPDRDRNLLFQASLNVGGNFDIAVNGDTWKYFPGLIEPSGGVFDPGLLIADDQRLGDNKFSDWIELHNAGDATVDLTGWTLTDDNTERAKWTFPAGTTIPSDGYLVVLADGAADAPGATMIHTNFKLSAGGEFLGLYDDTGAFRHGFAPRYPRQYLFSSYGTPPGGGDPVHLEYPTPGGPNTGGTFTGRADRPDFDVTGGFHPETITVNITTTTEGGTIRYTTDGSEPTLENGEDYTAALEIAPRNSRTGTVVRARTFKDGLTPSRVRTYTYLVGIDARLVTSPALIFAADGPETFYHPHGVLAIRGGQYSGGNWLARTDTDYNYARQRGRAMERPTNAEFYFPDNTVGFNTTAGIRMAASNWSRSRMNFSTSSLRASPWPNSSTQKPSFNLYFRDDYGNPDVSLPLNGTDYPVDNFTRLRIRAGKNDLGNSSNKPFIVDEWVRRLHHDMGHAASVGVLNSLWVNGAFKGYYNAVERLRHPFFADHHGADRDSEWDVYQAGNPDLVASGDRTSWDTLSSLLAAPQTSENWQAVLDYADVANIADYFLLNIYVAMWDWPHNNFVAARQRAPGGKFRFYVWDAEGGIANAGDSSISKDSIGILNSDSRDVARLWQAFMRWPEYKLFFADRINKFMFNGGTLDDRDPVNAHTKLRWDEVIAEQTDLHTFIHRRAPNTTIYTNWSRERRGRRDTYLFNSRGFTRHGLWPDTTPPVFSQHGGNVGPGFNLTVAHEAPAGSVVYYTTDGSDPRLFGGETSASAQVFDEASGLPLTDTLTTISVRVKNADGEWSPVTTATFTVDTVPADATNTIVAEVMYNPYDPTAAEIAAGVDDADEFEFIQLKNLGVRPVDLAGCEFVSGIAFDFDTADVRTIEPGGYLVVAENIEAFRLRYGDAFDTVLAGQFTGNLNNGGETVRLVNPAGETLHEFTYDDRAPWPLSADGSGSSLLLKSHISPALDHSDPANWTASLQYGGLPGGVSHETSFTAWRSTHFSPTDAADDNVSGAGADANNNGISNYIEFATGAFPGDPAVALERMPRAYVVEAGGKHYLTIDIRYANAAGLDATAEVSTDLVNWTPATEIPQPPVVTNPDGRTRIFQAPVALEDLPGQHIRAKFTQ